MRKLVISFLFFLCCVFTSFAQISFDVNVEQVQCNNSKLGSAEVAVTSGNGPYTYLWSNGATTSSIENITNGIYFVIITDNDGNDTTTSITVPIAECAMLPEDVFTPNGDEINDTWFISNSQYFPNARVIIFTRLGQKVFDSSGVYIPWDGKDLLGVALPDAAYYYLVYKDRSDENNVIKGVVSIVK